MHRILCFAFSLFDRQPWCLQEPVLSSYVHINMHKQRQANYNYNESRKQQKQRCNECNSKFSSLTHSSLKKSFLNNSSIASKLQLAQIFLTACTIVLRSSYVCSWSMQSMPKKVCTSSEMAYVQIPTPHFM